MALTDQVIKWEGGKPLVGQTYKAPDHFDFLAACKRFADSGMEFMLWAGNCYIMDKPDYTMPSAEAFAEAFATKVKSDGGPSTYYDFLPDWVTLNDAMEYLAEHRWGKYALHLKDSMKACFRFGSKDGADVAYDAKKLVYSGLRLLVMIQGKAKVHAFLLQLANDPQFQVKG